MTNELKISIKKGREWHVARGHPWLFSGGISQAPAKAEAGSIVTLLDYEGKFVATGYFNPACDIAVRVLSRKSGQKIDLQFLEDRIRSAWSLRSRALNLERTNVFRLINAEGDFLPGFIVDYYAGVVVIQSHTAGADKLQELMVEALKNVISPKAVIVRNDAGVRLREGLEQKEPLIAAGSIEGDLAVRENGLLFLVDPLGGQKTGYFTDQRDKRQALANYATGLGESGKLLNCFSYTCSFSVYAAAANAGLQTVNVDQSQSALELGRRNFSINGLAEEKHELVNMDAFSFMDRQIALNTRYDIAILDPPAFAKSHKDKPKALKAYLRMATLGMRLVRSGGLLVLCSCSGAISMDDFLESIRQGAASSDRDVQVLELFQHGLDHPFNLMAPEGTYLKVAFCRILD